MLTISSVNYKQLFAQLADSTIVRLGVECPQEQWIEDITDGKEKIITSSTHPRDDGIDLESCIYMQWDTPPYPHSRFYWAILVDHLLPVSGRLSPPKFQISLHPCDNLELVRYIKYSKSSIEIKLRSTYSFWVASHFFWKLIKVYNNSKLYKLEFCN